MSVESSFPPVLFSDEVIARRFEGSPFVDNHIEIVSSDLKAPSFRDKINLWSSYYQPGFVSSAIVLMGIVQRDLNLVGAGICSLMTEVGVIKISA
jgi:hypothetical protein